MRGRRWYAGILLAGVAATVAVGGLAGCAHRRHAARATQAPPLASRLPSPDTVTGGPASPDPAPAVPVGADHPLVIAHRGGAALAPENSMAAFRRAVSLGVDLLELDLHETADHRAVVAHDPVVEPWLCHGPAVRRRWEELSTGQVARLDCHGAPPPFLDDVLALLAANPRVGAMIETKTLGEPVARTVSLTRLLVDGAVRNGLAGRVTVQSFDWRTFAVPELRASGMRMAALSSRGGEVAAARATGATVYAPDFHTVLADADEVPAAHQAGMAVWVWTVDSPDDLRRMVDGGVDGIITDQPDRLLTLEGRR
jgi:glycerophosphoryl diester phosphodiesterase